MLLAFKQYRSIAPHHYRHLIQLLLKLEPLPTTFTSQKYKYPAVYPYTPSPTSSISIRNVGHIHQWRHSVFHPSILYVPPKQDAETCWWYKHVSIFLFLEMEDFKNANMALSLTKIAHGSYLSLTKLVHGGRVRRDLWRRKVLTIRASIFPLDRISWEGMLIS